MNRDEATEVIINIGPELKRLLFLETPEVWLDIDLTMVQFKSLIIIINHKNISPSKLAKILGVTPANITGIVDNLVKLGLVTRTESPRDRRVLLLEATEKSSVLLTNMMQRSARDMAFILELIPDEEINCLAQGLVALVSAASRRRELSEGTADLVNLGGIAQID